MGGKIEILPDCRIGHFAVLIPADWDRRKKNLQVPSPVFRAKTMLGAIRIDHDEVTEPLISSAEF